MLFGFCCARLGLHGIITSTVAVGLGATGAVFVQFRTDRGLWMLAVLFISILSAVYGICIVGEARDVLRNAPQPPLALVIDYSVTTLLVSTNLRC